MKKVKKPIVTITGISGFIGSQTCLAFLQHGQFSIRGTMRSKNDPNKIEPLKRAFGDHFSELELVEADLLDDNSIRDVVRGSKFVVHLATTSKIERPKDAKEMIRTDVEGMLSVMRAAKASNVKRVVLSSTIEAINYNKEQNRYAMDEWADTSKMHVPWVKSKALAEKAAWDFIDDLPDHQKFDLVSLNLDLVFGPNYSKDKKNVGGVLIRSMMMNHYLTQYLIRIYPNISLGMVDVRDVAKAYLQAVLQPEAAGKRIILAEDTYWPKDVAEVLLKKYSNKGYSVSQRKPFKFPYRLMSIYDKGCREQMKKWGVKTMIDNSESKDILKIKYRSMDTMIDDMARDLILSGFIPGRFHQTNLMQNTSSANLMEAWNHAQKGKGKKNSKK